MKSRIQFIKGLAAAIILIIIDQLTKYAAASCLKGKDSFVLIPGVLEFHYLENQSAAFSIDPVSLLQKLLHISYFENHPDAFLSVKMYFFAVLTILVVILLVILYRRIPADSRFVPVNIVLIAFIAGAIGNLIDRIMNHYVIDFIYFSLINFPIFNVADIYVTCAAFAFLFLGIFYYKEEDFDLIFNKENSQK